MITLSYGFTKSLFLVASLALFTDAEYICGKVLTRTTRATDKETCQTQLKKKDFAYTFDSNGAASYCHIHKANKNSDSKICVDSDISDSKIECFIVENTQYDSTNAKHCKNMCKGDYLRYDGNLKKCWCSQPIEGEGQRKPRQHSECIVTAKIRRAKIRRSSNVPVCPCFYPTEVYNTVSYIADGTMDGHCTEENDVLRLEFWNSTVKTTGYGVSLDKENPSCLIGGEAHSISQNEGSRCVDLVESACSSIGDSSILDPLTPPLACPCFTEEDVTSLVSTIQDQEDKTISEGSCSRNQVSIMLMINTDRSPIGFGQNGQQCNSDDAHQVSIGVEEAARCHSLISAACDILDPLLPPLSCPCFTEEDVTSLVSTIQDQEDKTLSEGSCSSDSDSIKLMINIDRRPIGFSTDVQKCNKYDVHQNIGDEEAAYCRSLISTACHILA